MIQRRAILTFLGVYTLCLLVEFGGSLFTQMSVTTWYPTLHKSALTPPSLAFPIAWTLLYFLMALAATRIRLRTGSWRVRALRWWLIQLIFGLLWSVMFFGHRDISAAMQVIVANWITVLITIYFFRRVDTIAAWMLAPLLLWLSLASYLNFYILLHN